MDSLKAILLLLLFPLLSAASTQTVSLEYYSESISLRYNSDMIPDVEIKATEESTQEYFKALEASDFEQFLSQIADYKEKLHLNSYLQYDLMRQTINSICQDKSGNYKTMLQWFLLSKAGFDTRLTRLGQAIFLYVHTNENVYNIPIIQIEGRDYINLTNINHNYGSPKGGSAYMIDFVINEKGKALSFKLDNLPRLTPQPIFKEMIFAHRNELFRFEITLDKTLIDVMKDYPLVDELYYLEAPISDNLKNSLVAKLRELIKDRDEKESIQFLLSLTRTAFDYKTDVDNFGKNKPMIPDEVLFYPHSDCEDRSALFYALVKELVDLPTIIVDYPEHLTVGVALPNNVGKPLLHKGRQYTICDPTGPNNTDEVGVYPEGYEALPYKIMVSYK